MHLAFSETAGPEKDSRVDAASVQTGKVERDAILVKGGKVISYAIVPILLGRGRRARGRRGQEKTIQVWISYSSIT